MFNFFNELICDYGLTVDSFNLVNISNKFVYVEGINKVVCLKDNQISVKVKKGFINIFGQNLVVKRITKTTISIVGKIFNIESNVWKIVRLKFQM